MPRIGDVVAPGLRALFVGINPGLRSAALGHNFAGKGNPFWRLLHAAELIGEPLGFADERRLLEFGFGISNLCSRPTRSADELTRDELAAGARTLEKRLRRLRPQVVVLVGLTIYQQIFGRAATPGAGAKPQTFGGARLFVVPNPSGLNASFPGFQQKLVWFEALRLYLEETEDGTPAQQIPAKPGTAIPQPVSAREKRRKQP
jgi:double-stranded uracil-DNA glycosylase